MILRIRIFVNRKILILKIFLRKMTILRKIVRIRLIPKIRIFVHTDPDLITLSLIMNSLVTDAWDNLLLTIPMYHYFSIPYGFLCFGFHDLFIQVILFILLYLFGTV